MLAFAVDSLAAILFVYSTGTFLLRAMRLPWTWAVMGAPAASLCIYALLGEVYYVLGVPATPSTVCAIPLVVLAALAYISGRLFLRQQTLPQTSWQTIALYIGVGLFFGIFVFARSLPYPGAVFQTEDISRHALQVQAFIDSRCFSSLHSSVYQDNLSIAPRNAASFYPCAWHILCALVEQLTGDGVPIAMNASNFVLSSCVYPTSACGLLATVLDNHPKAIKAGALACVSMTAFPWALLVFGPLFPNLAGIACLPIVAFFFIHASTPEQRSFVSRLTLLTCFLITSCGMALAHPNAVFSAAVILIPYCCQLASRLRIGRATKFAGPRIRTLLAAAVCTTIWILLRYSSAFRGVASFNWAAYTSPWQSLLNVATFSFTYGFGDLNFVAQPVIAFAALLGGVSLLKDSRRSWMVASHVFASIICMVCMSTEGELKHLLGGFWYTDPFRLAATAAVTALPLVAFGLCQMADAISDFCEQRGAFRALPQASPINPRHLIYGALALLIVIPSSTIPGIGTFDTAFTNVRLAVKDMYSLDNPYSPEERAFVEHAKKLMGDDALVINYPLDGSILAYGFDDLNCYYRTRWGYNDEYETAESSVIRQRLCDLSEAQDVRDAVDAIGAQYVIVLDPKGAKDTFLYWYWHPEYFSGITSIDQTTPGFEMILEEDGMYLYRIAA